MSSEHAKTTLALYDKMKDLATEGRIDRNALRAALGSAVTNFQFNMGFYAARTRLQHEGYFIKPSRGERGVYIIATSEDVADKAINKSRVALVKKARQRMVLLQDAQRHVGMDDDSRSRVATEELLYGRTLHIMERALLRSQRKRPEGLE